MEELAFYLFIYLFLNYFIVVQLQLSAFLPHHSPPPQPVGGRVFRNYYKGHMGKNQGGGWKQGRVSILNSS